MRCALILGAAVWPGGRPSPTLARRTRHALAIWRAGEVDRLICCGGLGRHGPSEAEVMARLLIADGVPGEVIAREDRSTTTLENIAFAQEFLSDCKEIIIVTDRYHAPRARVLARGLGLRVRSASPDHRASPRAVLREGFAFLKLGWWLLRGAPKP